MPRDREDLAAPLGGDEPELVADEHAEVVRQLLADHRLAAGDAERARDHLAARCR